MKRCSRWPSRAGCRAGASTIRRWGLALLLGGGIAWVAHRRRTLTPGGAVAAAAVGTVVFARQGLPGAGALLAFFVSSSALSRLPRADAVQAKGAQRDALQVLANGGIASLCSVLGWQGGLVGALATACADTWATEIGTRRGGRPRLITTFEQVEAGRSGGVTVIGLGASIGGAACVGAGWRLCGGQPAFAAAAAAGTVGALADSVLGATVQALYQCTVCNRTTEAREHCGQLTHLLGGMEWIDNDVVNALATLAGATVGELIWRIDRTRRSTCWEGEHVVRHAGWGRELARALGRRSLPSL